MSQDPTAPPARRARTSEDSSRLLVNIPPPPGGTDPYEGPVEDPPARAVDRRSTEPYDDHPFDADAPALEVAPLPPADVRLRADLVSATEQPAAQAALPSLGDGVPFEDEVAPPTPSPRELARRLAEEARARASAGRGAVEPPSPPTKATPPPPEPLPPEKRGSSLADRARRPMSAATAMKAAAVAEREAPAPKKKSAKTARPSEAEPAPSRSAGAPTAAPAFEVPALVARVAPRAELQRTVLLRDRVVFRALWLAHRARALATADLPLAVTAGVLLDAVDRVPEGCLHAVHLSLGDRQLAAWVDTHRGVVLGIAESPELYLAGL
jgi:hypothetical protein